MAASTARSIAAGSSATSRRPRARSISPSAVRRRRSAAALNLANRLPQIIGLAAALAVVAGVAGLVISYQLEIAAGASIALCAIALSSLGMLKPKLGMP